MDQKEETAQCIQHSASEIRRTEEKGLLTKVLQNNPNGQPLTCTFPSMVPFYFHVVPSDCTGCIGLDSTHRCAPRPNPEQEASLVYSLPPSALNTLTNHVNQSPWAVRKTGHEDVSELRRRWHDREMDAASSVVSACSRRVSKVGRKAEKRLTYLTNRPEML